jgi:hypothetical protein
MKRQNPPQSHLDKAVEIEKYLRPVTIASLYAIAGVFIAALITVVYAIFHRFDAKPPLSSAAMLTAIASIPVVLAVLAYFVTPHDPLSLYIRVLANAWRRPLTVAPSECTFNELLGDGENLCIRAMFYYPFVHQTAEMKEQLYTYVNGILSRECSAYLTVPSNQELERAIDPALELIASEHEIPVLYLEVQSVFKMPRPFNFSGENMATEEYWSTGT